MSEAGSGWGEWKGWDLFTYLTERQEMTSEPQGRVSSGRKVPPSHLVR